MNQRNQRIEEVERLKEVNAEMLAALKGLQFLSIAKPPGIDRAAWEAAFDRLEKAIDHAERGKP